MYFVNIFHTVRTSPIRTIGDSEEKNIISKVYVYIYFTRFTSVKVSLLMRNRAVLLQFLL